MSLSTLPAEIIHMIEDELFKVDKLCLWFTCKRLMEFNKFEIKYLREEQATNSLRFWGYLKEEDKKHRYLLTDRERGIFLRRLLRMRGDLLHGTQINLCGHCDTIQPLSCFPKTPVLQKFKVNDREVCEHCIADLMNEAIYSRIALTQPYKPGNTYNSCHKCGRYNQQWDEPEMRKHAVSDSYEKIWLCSRNCHSQFCHDIECQEWEGSRYYFLKDAFLRLRIYDCWRECLCVPCAEISKYT